MIQHKVTIGTHGKKGVPVTCTCGFKGYAFTTMGAYKIKRQHLEQANHRRTQ